MAFASPVVIDDGSSSIAWNIYAHLVGTEVTGCSPNEKHGFYSLMQFLCTHKKASQMVGLNCPEALCTPEVRVRELGRNPALNPNLEAMAGAWLSGGYWLGPIRYENAFAGKTAKATQEDGGKRNEERGKRKEERGKRKEERGKRKEERGKRKEERGKRKEERGKRKEERGNGVTASIE